jgi:hypothetical protein
MVLRRRKNRAGQADGNLLGAVCKENKDDLEKLKAYFRTGVKEKVDKKGGAWKEYYQTASLLK